MTAPPREISGGSDLARRLAKSDEGHKYKYGHLLVLSGGPGNGGAARLSARAGLRIGAGLVTLVCPIDALVENAAQLTSVMVRDLEEPDDLNEMLQDERINAICLGPGLGLDDDARALVRIALAGRRAAVLDADAITAFAGAPMGLIAQLHDNVVLTPHQGEFRRLFPDIAGSETSQITQCQAAAKLSGAVVLLKGTETVVAAPDGRCATHVARGDDATPWLATAGSGDVLAGLIAGLLARGFGPFAAACDATWIHAAAARNFGPGLIAEDLPDLVPSVLRDLGL